MSYRKDFEAAHPKPLDFPQGEYDMYAAEIDAAAAALGYRQAGVRLGLVIFTSKPEKKA